MRLYRSDTDSGSGADMSMSGVSRGRCWAYAGVVLGGAVSVAANVAHSYIPPASELSGWSPEPGAVISAVFWPIALFVAVEIFARVSWRQGLRWLLIRWAGLSPVAVVAAVVSYRHLAGLLAFYGEDTLVSAVGPLAVDGLMVMATAALVATSTPSHRDKAAEADTICQADSATDAARTGNSDTSRPADAEDTADMSAVTRGRGRRGSASRTRRQGGGDKAARVATLRAANPDMPTADIARRVGVSSRTVRRYLSTTHTPGDTSAEPDRVADRHNVANPGTSDSGTATETPVRLEVAASPSGSRDLVVAGGAR